MVADSAPAPILVIDDDPNIRSFVSDVLTDEGYEVVQAEHGGAALAALDRMGSHPPAAILLDVNMPIMDGYGFAAAYRERPGPHAPIVVITAAHSARQRCAEIGAQDCLGKPFDLDQLLARVEHFTQHPPPHNQAAA